MTGGNPLTVQVVDQYGNVVTEAGDTVNLTSTSTGAHGGLFYASAGSSTPITSVMTGPSGSVSFYYEDSTLGHPTITASDTNTRLVGPAAMQIETVAATAPYQIAFTTSARNADGRDEVRDHHGPGRGPVRQRHGRERRHHQPHHHTGTGLFYLTASGGSAITIVTTNANGTASFYYTDTTVGTPDANGHDTTAPDIKTTQSRRKRSTPAGAFSITFNTTPETQTAGTKSATITVLVKDQFGNVHQQRGGGPQQQRHLRPASSTASAGSTRRSPS